MASGAITDDPPDAKWSIKIVVHINKEYESTNNLDLKQDICKHAELDQKSIKLSNLKTHIPLSFRDSTSFKSLFTNDNYVWKLFLYDPTKADIEIATDDDLATFHSAYDEDDTQDSVSVLKLRVVFFKGIDDEKSCNQLQVISHNKNPRIIIQKGEIISPYIQATFIDHEIVTIQLSLDEPATTKTTFYIYECGAEDGDKLARIQIKKKQTKTVKDIDLEEIDNISFKIAIYQKQHDTKPISNVLQITKPVEENPKNYVANPILLSTVKAIEADDEKNENIYVYFDLPSNIQGEDIGFKIKYVGDDNKESISLPLTISK
eukprot:437027_1